ncbi:hypothetical protein [Halorubrum halodurans]|uniref:Uncharacterized protein n=1 Tax=Halorubrum halodurans TaxID=1383851 RepID=A0A256IPX9_9EURY|nr:hypothetical protein [Halorubrum halodurans]OYR58619.1 hypothetical protein DJ70_02515 [Halorubrum halodurans]
MTRRSKREIERSLEELDDQESEGGLLPADMIWWTDGDGNVVGRSDDDGTDFDASNDDLPDDADPEDIELLADFTGAQS